MPHKRLLALAAIVCGGIIFYLCYRAEGNWGFVLPYRGQKLLAMLLVGSAIASATMVFQTLTANRILTPSIIGLDAIYLHRFQRLRVRKVLLPQVGVGACQQDGLGAHPRPFGRHRVGTVFHPEGRRSGVVVYVEDSHLRTWAAPG